MMRIVVHAGMPKAGSTSIQNTFLAHQEELLAVHGVFFPTPRTAFRNHFELYDGLLQDPDLANELVRGALTDASRAGAKTVVFSSEDLFFLSTHGRALDDLVDILCSQRGTDPMFLLVVRETRGWIRSHIMQLIANGAFAPGDNGDRYFGLGTLAVACIKSFHDRPVPTKLVPLSSPTDGELLIPRFMAAINVHGGAYPDRQDNPTGEARFISTEFLVGAACGLRAANGDVHPNSPEVDELRAGLREALENPALSSVLEKFENVLTGEVEFLVDRACRELSREDDAFMNAVAAGKFA